MTDIVEAAEGHWHHVLTTLGVDPKHLGVNKPCPVCGGDDRFTFTDKGKGFYFCRGEHKGDGFKLLYELFGWEFKDAAKEVQRVLGIPEKVPFRHKRDPVPYLNRLWTESRPVRENDEAHRYFMGRGLSAVPPALRYHPGLRVEGKTYPCILGMFVDVSGRPESWHKTFILNGRKAPIEDPKRVATPKNTITGCAIRLWPAEGAVVLTEGIENAVAAHLFYRLPAWAAFSADNLAAVRLPDEIRKVIVVGDNDAHKKGRGRFKGNKAATDLAYRLSEEGRDVDLFIPPVPGMDILDEYLLRQGRAA